MSLSFLFCLQIFTFTLSNCSTNRHEKSVSSNDYYYAFKILAEAERKQYFQSYDDFLEWSLKKTLIEFQNQTRRRPSIESLPLIRLHGIATPYQIKVKDGQGQVFTNTENSFDGNPLWDLITMGISAYTLGKTYRSTNLKVDHCLRAYQSELQARIDRPSLPPLILPSTLMGTLKDSKTTKALNPLNPSTLSAISKIFGKEATSFKDLSNNFHHANEPAKLVTLADESQWKITPLSYLTNCADYKKTLQMYSAKSTNHCFKNTTGISYAIEQILPSELFVESKHLNEENLLKTTSDSLCRQLAFRHIHQLTPSDRQKLYLIILHNPSIVSWYISFVTKHGDKILDAYRASLAL